MRFFVRPFVRHCGVLFLASTFQRPVAISGWRAFCSAEGVTAGIVDCGVWFGFLIARL
jgi:hypothetical protein